jgi:hypothetical protein
VENKGFGQRFALKFLFEEGYAPSCSDRISASSPVKSGAGIFRQEKGEKSSGPAQEARFDRLRALR